MKKFAIMLLVIILSGCQPGKKVAVQTAPVVKSITVLMKTSKVLPQRQKTDWEKKAITILKHQVACYPNIPAIQHINFYEYQYFARWCKTNGRRDNINSLKILCEEYWLKLKVNL